MHEVTHQAIVEVFAAEVSVASGCLDLEDPLLDGEQAHVERTAAQVEDQDVPLPARLRFLVEAVGNGGGSGLVDHPNDIEARDGAGIFGRLSLAVVEVRWTRDDGVFD
mmetsp:Transcript_10867/g.19030  ORF Transcript_10867/g.19030 Transcript_10867/m.19030 type:complete len:108 (+) Transcript_10867:1645-1968(+)